MIQALEISCEKSVQELKMVTLVWLWSYLGKDGLRNGEMGGAGTNMEICLFDVKCSRNSLLCSQLLFQPSLRKVEPAEDVVLQCFQFHSLLSSLVCKGMPIFTLNQSHVQSSYVSGGFDSHICVFLFL